MTLVQPKTTSISLRALQQWMRWIVVDPRGVGPALQKPHPLNSLHPDRYVEPKISAYHLIDGTGAINAEERLAVYAEGYFSRIIEVLESDFVTTKKILGEELFLKFISDYLKEYPSCTANISELGRSLVSFVKTHPFQNEVPYLQDMISLEWHIIESFYANDLPPLDIRLLATISEDQWESAKIILDTSVRLLKFNWSVNELWQNRYNENFETIEDALRQESVCLCLYRSKGDVVIEQISFAQFKVLSAMQGGFTLGYIAQEIDENDSDNLMHWFAQWTRCGLIQKIDFF